MMCTYSDSERICSEKLAKSENNPSLINSATKQMPTRVKMEKKNSFDPERSSQNESS